MSGPVAGNRAGSLDSDLRARIAYASVHTLGCDHSQLPGNRHETLNGSAMLRGRVLSGLARQSNSDITRQKIVCYESKHYDERSAMKRENKKRRRS
jgi:hypothetical protein